MTGPPAAGAVRITGGAATGARDAEILRATGMLRAMGMLRTTGMLRAMAMPRSTAVLRFMGVRAMRDRAGRVVPARPGFAPGIG